MSKRMVDAPGGFVGESIVDVDPGNGYIVQLGLGCNLIVSYIESSSSPPSHIRDMLFAVENAVLNS
jgi:hypothetical protein